MRPLPFSGELFYAVIFWGAYILWILGETIAWAMKRSADTSRARDRGSLNLLYVLIWIALGLGFALSFLLPQAAIEWRRTWVFFLGISLMLAGIAVRWYCMAVLGRYFTFDVAVHADQTVIETGPYRYVRHPSYSGALLTLLGFGLALGNWAALVAVLACMGIAYAYRIRVEEAALVAALGEPYIEYMRRTRRLVPFLF
ncbi:MAG TPA: isoprenylcysteine carboxylmethyltransferase family protein [Candidatus Acidoferrum sp.]|nr:isoprenylcysteine carboxylmethyltransferase family protein [Candidatus Acidoferrum sp.]